MQIPGGPMQTDDQQYDREALLAQMGQQGQQIAQPQGATAGTSGLAPSADTYNPAAGVANDGVAGPVQPVDQGSTYQRLTGRVGDRDAEANSAHDVFNVWQQQYGKGPGATRDENIAALQDFAKYAQQYGFQVNPLEHEKMDKVDIRTPDGRLIRGADLIGNAGGAPGTQSWWFGDEGQESGGLGTSPEGGFAASGSGAVPAGPGGPSSFQGIQGLMPTDMDFHNTLQQRLQAILGAPASGDREALLSMLGGQAQ
jgi:hypothetical protein